MRWWQSEKDHRCVGSPKPGSASLLECGPILFGDTIHVAEQVPTDAAPSAGKWSTVLATSSICSSLQTERSPPALGRGVVWVVPCGGGCQSGTVNVPPSVGHREGGATVVGREGGATVGRAL